MATETTTYLITALYAHKDVSLGNTAEGGCAPSISQAIPQTQESFMFVRTATVTTNLTQF